MRRLTVIYFKTDAITKKKNFEDFYNEIRDQFPKMRELDTWGEMASWVTQGKESDVQRLMTIDERYSGEGDVPVTSIITGRSLNL